MTTYQTILTTYGIARVAAAIASGVPINLTHMSVGDGGGSAVTPTPSMTALVNEVYRTTPNTVSPVPGDATQYLVEMLINSSTGGWTIRELGIWDDAGNLFAVGNYPATYKTTISDGAVSDLVIAAECNVGNASAVTLMVDPSVAIATRSWALENITAATIAPGGTTGQVWTKHSNTNGDATWQSPSTANVTVNIVQEDQTAGAGQATFTLATTTTDSLAVYKNGIRIPYRTGAGGWQKGTPALTQVVLGTACAGGEEMLFIQNEPAGFLVTPLDATLNLSDLTNVATARANLSVYSKTESDQLSPPGHVSYFAMSTAPTGWLKCNGALVSRTTYSRLFSAIGTVFGAGDGSTTFQLPDLRGEFLRAYDDGRGVDTGRAFASFEDWSTAAPKNTSPLHLNPDGTTRSLNVGTNPSYAGFARSSKSGENTTATGTDAGQAILGEVDVLNVATGDAETRPRNIALLVCIKY